MARVKVYYSLLQIMPDKYKQEVINIGVALISPSCGYVGIQIAINYKRIALVFGERWANLAVASYSALTAEFLAEVTATLPSLHAFAAKSRPSFRFTAPAQCRIENGSAPQFLDRLTTTLISGRPQCLAHHETRRERP